ncbi:proline-rich protein 5-like isoform X2 [Oscarella lobularis]
MIILREAVKEETGIALLKKLAQLWERFFCIILPKLQAIFCPIEVLNCSVQSLTLLSFRDIIVLKTKLDEALREQEGNVPPRIKQMLLVLQGVRESPPTENLIKLESMVGLVVRPYLRPSFLSHAYTQNRSEKHRFKTSQSETGTQHPHVLHGALSIPGAPTGVSTATPLRHTSSSGTINPIHRSRSYSVHEIIPKASRLHAGGGSSGGGSSRRSNEAIPDAIYKEFVKGSTLSLDELSTRPQRLSKQQRAEILAEFSDLKSTVV